MGNKQTKKTLRTNRSLNLTARTLNYSNTRDSRAEQLLVKGGIRKDLSRETECAFFSMT